MRQHYLETIEYVPDSDEGELLLATEPHPMVDVTVETVVDSEDGGTPLEFSQLSDSEEGTPILELSEHELGWPVDEEAPEKAAFSFRDFLYKSPSKSPRRSSTLNIRSTSIPRPKHDNPNSPVKDVQDDSVQPIMKKDSTAPQPSSLRYTQFISLCPLCNCEWTVKKSAKAKTSHIRECARVRFGLTLFDELQTIVDCFVLRLHDRETHEECSSLFDRTVGKGQGSGPTARKSVRIIGSDDLPVNQLQDRIDKLRQRPRSTSLSRAAQEIIKTRPANFNEARLPPVSQEILQNFDAKLTSDNTTLDIFLLGRHGSHPSTGTAPPSTNGELEILPAEPDLRPEHPVKRPRSRLAGAHRRLWDASAGLM